MPFASRTLGMSKLAITHLGGLVLGSIEADFFKVNAHIAVFFEIYSYTTDAFLHRSKLNITLITIAKIIVNICDV